MVEEFRQIWRNERKKKGKGLRQDWRFASIEKEEKGNAGSQRNLSRHGQSCANVKPIAPSDKRSQNLLHPNLPPHLLHHTLLLRYRIPDVAIRPQRG